MAMVFHCVAFNNRATAMGTASVRRAYLCGSSRAVYGYSKPRRPQGGGDPSMKNIFEVADFLRNTRRKLRFGELSRAPLHLLRLEINEYRVKCDWYMRPADEWDDTLPAAVRENNQSMQAFLDAMRVRELLFATFREISIAELRVFRPSGEETPELVMAGTVRRDDDVPARIGSVVMQAILLGFHFSFSNGALMAMVPNAR
jgi:hypothetical protein